MALNEKLVLPPGGHVENLDLRVLPPEAHTISGTVLDGQGNPRAGVVMGTYIPHDRAWWIRTDPQGRFELQSLNGIGRDPLDVDFDFDDCKVVFRNVPIGTRDLKCIKHPPGQVSGVLLDEDGIRPVTNYEIKVERVHLLGCAGIALGPVAKVTQPGAPGAFHIAIKGAIQFPEEDCDYVHILLREAGLDFPPNVWSGRPAATDRALNWTSANKSSSQYEILHVPAGTWEVVAFAPASERYPKGPVQAAAICRLSWLRSG
jgi:hypothetical protein